jgi:hypothetical protein
MDPVYVGSISGLAMFGASILCCLSYFAYECRRYTSASRQEALLRQMDAEV